MGESLSDSDKLGSRGGWTDGAGGEGVLWGVDWTDASIYSPQGISSAEHSACVYPETRKARETPSGRALCSGPGAPVRVLTRNPEDARFPPQVEVVPGDLTRPETLDACLESISTVFLVWVAPPAAVAPAIEQITRRARRIVFLSAPLKTAHPLFQQPNPARTLAYWTGVNCS